MSVFPTKILLATDGSEAASQATEAATDLAGKSGSELHVVHVWHDVPGFAHGFVKRELRRQGQETLDEQVERIEGSGGTVTQAHLRGGRTSEEIVGYARVPVLVVRRGDGAWPPERVIIGEDFSDDARKAGDLAASIGGLYGSRALLINAGEHRGEEDEERLRGRAGELEGILGSPPEASFSD